MSKKTILVAAHELRGRPKAKDGETAERVTIAVGTEITAKVKGQLGLDGDAVEQLVASGAIAEVPVSIAEDPADGGVLDDLRTQLTAAEQRATDAETKLAAAAAELKKLKPAT
ncbi:MAG: hypothetical protein FJ335_07510 [Sphingomonadales bacterium]|nr:hypothetical protein [Sphingomonadales bacterium]